MKDNWIGSTVSPDIPITPVRNGAMENVVNLLARVLTNLRYSLSLLARGAW
jgi:hypothetical protein